MKPRSLRHLWFAGIWFLFPWPLLVLQDAFVPAARYVLLGTAAGAVALTEGAAGPVALLVALFVAWGIGTSLLSWLLAWLLTKLTSPLPKRAAAAFALTTLGLGLLWAVVFEPYRTPFGRALRGGLLQVLS